MLDQFGAVALCVNVQRGRLERVLRAPAQFQILLEDYMSRFVENPTDFSAECMCKGGLCAIGRENFLFLDNGNELAAVGRLQTKCGHIVIIPDASSQDEALLYHTSCQRMTDVVSQIFRSHLQAPASLPQASPEMTLGTLYRRRITISYDRCRAKVEGFRFGGTPQG